ncbi:hypothetical protein LOK49_LG12G00640 [Camellia lanceoleosa]|uniref:Uncharacterized protein n=1 Tax=Camellia lanceoleosa TaxID=1840588 RepID=A0ACC0FWT3_9ERIC|nr:hypothetical protein LOK49_LG12G00640 [Camellia lanceoleosa]
MVEREKLNSLLQTRVNNGSYGSCLSSTTATAIVLRHIGCAFTERHFQNNNAVVVIKEQSGSKVVNMGQLQKKRSAKHCGRTIQECKLGVVYLSPHAALGNPDDRSFDNNPMHNSSSFADMVQPAQVAPLKTKQALLSAGFANGSLAPPAMDSELVPPNSKFPIKFCTRSPSKSLRRKNPNHRSLQLPFVFRSFLSTLRSPLPLSSQPPMPHPTLLLRRTSQGNVKSLLNPKDRDRMELVLKYIEDADLRRWILPNIKAFNIGLGEWRSMLNCITNPHMYEQLLEISSADLIVKGISYISTRQDAAKKLLDKVFKVRLGRGFYGECLGVRADGNSNLSDEIGKELSIKSAAAGLRPIGAVVYMQRNNLKMCLRSTDTATDTSEVAKAYGGGGSPSSSSFIIRMDEYNQWLSVHQP